MESMSDSSSDSGSSDSSEGIDSCDNDDEDIVVHETQASLIVEDEAVKKAEDVGTRVFGNEAEHELTVIESSLI